MASPFVGEIRIVGFNFAPTGWAACDGQLIPIPQNTALFSLLGTFYGGDGRSTFALPNLRGSAPIGVGQSSGLSSYATGESAGSATVTLLSSEMPVHTHQMTLGKQATASAGNQAPPQGAFLAETGRAAAYNTGGALDTGMGQLTTPVGSSLPHNNLPPFLVLNFIIAMQGVYPPRT